VTHKFVDFIQQKDGITNSDVFQSMNDAAWHRPNVCPSVTANVRLITDTAESYSASNVTSASEEVPN